MIPPIRRNASQQELLVSLLDKIYEFNQEPGQYIAITLLPGVNGNLQVIQESGDYQTTVKFSDLEDAMKKLNNFLP